MNEITPAAIQAAHLTIYQTPIEFEWESHPHLTETEANQVPLIINNLLANHKASADLLTNPSKETN